MVSQFGRKLLVASVLSAITGVANAAAPTLGEVLKSSGIDVTGYIDAAFTYRDTSGTANASTFRAYDQERSSFILHALDVTVSSLPSSGFGGLAEITFGNDADFNGATGSDKSDKVDPLQAFLQYSSGSFAVLAGKFTTLAGAEVAQQPANTNYSRSLLYTNAIPVTHVGVRGVFTMSDAFKFTAGINNGWDAMTTSVKSNGADGKTIELGFSATPSKMFSLAASAYIGEEAGTGTDAGERQLIDIVGTVNLSDAMSLVLNVDVGKQDNDAAGTEAKWNGVAGYFNYKFSDTWRISVRGEQFNDKNCFKLSCSGSFSDLKVKEGTVTVGYVPAKNAELRFEVRQDKADRDAFMEGGVATDKQMSVAVEGLYKF